MSRPTQKSIRAQNEALLNDAKSRLNQAETAVATKRQELASAEAVLNHARDAYNDIEKRLNPEK